MNTLIIRGSHDQVSPLAAGEHFHQSLQCADMITILQSSHQVFEEKPDEVAKAILEFISKSLKTSDTIFIFCVYYYQGIEI